MTKNEYLIKALNAKLYNSINWITSVVTTARNIEPFDYLVYEHEGEWVFDVDGERFVIDDHEGGVMFVPATPITLSKNDVINYTGDKPIDTHFGILYANYVLLVDCFGSGIEYINGEIDVEDVEEIIATRMEDDGIVRETNHIYVQDKLKFTDQVTYLRSQSMLFTVVATPKNMTAPDKIKEKRAVILEKYEGKLDSTVMQAEFEKEMSAIDDEWLADDPTLGHLIKGKMKTSRLKMYGTFGSSTGFDNTPTPHIVGSIDEGLPSEGDEFVGLINSLRAGSHSRSKLTEIGGTTANIINRALSPIVITEQDCHSKVYKEVTLRKGDEQRYIGIYARRENGNVTPIKKEEIKPGVTKMVRTVLYCATEGANICKTCAGDKLSERPKALVLAVSHINSRIIYYFMKKFHATVLVAKRVNIIERIS